MDDNLDYAKYMIRWVNKLELPSVSVSDSSFKLLQQYWLSDNKVNLEEVREQLWTWVDENGGPAPSTDKTMCNVRMVLCLAYENNQELKEMGYFEDLLVNVGVPRSEIQL